MSRYHFLLCVAIMLAFAPLNLAGCAYTRAMDKAELDRSRIKTEIQLTDANLRIEGSRKASLEKEHEQLRKEIAVQNHTLASLQRRISTLSMVPARSRSSGQQTQIDKLQSDIAMMQRRINEKKERLRNLNEKL